MRSETEYNRLIFKAVLQKKYSVANALTAECNEIYGKPKKATPKKRPLRASKTPPGVKPPKKR